MGTEGMLYTRGGPEAEDNRGQSMVQKHAENLQRAKETLALEKVQALFPNLDSSISKLALKECGFETEAALSMIRRFLTVHDKEIAALEKDRRQRLVELAGGGESSGSDSSSDDSASDKEDERSKRRSRGRKPRGNKRSRRSKESSKKRSRDKDRKKDRRRKRDRSRSEDAPRRSGASLYGKYGVIREVDLYNKRPEFTIWANEVCEKLEVKSIDIEIMPRGDEKELFREYMEDYNTATLPGRRFYDLEAHERRERERAARRGGAGASRAGERTAFDDERELRREQAEARAAGQRVRQAEAYAELRSGDKAAAMKEQELLRAQMNLAYRTGNREEAQKLAARLAPDEAR